MADGGLQIQLDEELADSVKAAAAALGVPVYSIFRGTIGGVDRHLSAEGRLVLIESVQDVSRKIDLTRRTRRNLSEVTSRQTLQELVNAIIQTAEGACNRTR